MRLGSGEGTASVAQSMVSTTFSVHEEVEAPEAAGALLNTLHHAPKPQPHTFTAAKN
jgi:hypothetical protein